MKWIFTHHIEPRAVAALHCIPGSKLVYLGSAVSTGRSFCWWIPWKRKAFDWICFDCVIAIAYLTPSDSFPVWQRWIRSSRKLEPNLTNLDAEILIFVTLGKLENCKISCRGKIAGENFTFTSCALCSCYVVIGWSAVCFSCDFFTGWVSRA